MLEANFSDDLVTGHSWEIKFANNTIFKNRGITRLGGKGSDFKFPNSLTLELKTEKGWIHFDKFVSKQNNIRCSKNIFVEQYSNLSKKTLGGPFQAIKNNTDYYCSWFPWENELFLWRTYRFVEQLNVLISNNTINPSMVRNILNKGYVTQGWAVPMSILLSKTNGLRIDMTTSEYTIFGPNR